MKHALRYQKKKGFNIPNFNFFKELYLTLDHNPEQPFIEEILKGVYFDAIK